MTVCEILWKNSAHNKINENSLYTARIRCCPLFTNVLPIPPLTFHFINRHSVHKGSIGTYSVHHIRSNCECLICLAIYFKDTGIFRVCTISFTRKVASKPAFDLTYISRSNSEEYQTQSTYKNQTLALRSKFVILYI